MTASSFLKISSLTGICSKAASITTSQSAMSSRFSTGWMRAKRRCFGRCDRFVEQFAFERAAFVERQFAGGLDRVDAGIRRALVAGAAGDRFAGGLEQLEGAFGETVAAIADFRQWLCAGDFAG